MVQTMAARTCSGKPGPRGAEGVLALYGYYAPSGGAQIEGFMWGKRRANLNAVCGVVVHFDCGEYAFKGGEGFGYFWGA